MFLYNTLGDLTKEDSTHKFFLQKQITSLQVEAFLTQHVTNDAPSLPTSPTTEGEAMAPTPRQIWEAVLALAVCHNVTPVYDMDDQRADEAQSGNFLLFYFCLL